VARFVGNDRGLKRLSLATLEDLELEPITNGASGPRAPVQTSLRDALSIMLTHRNEPLVATDEQGEPVGLATVDAVSAALSS
jgi:osmoprotectant transport system ATP-binding protein